MKSKSALTRPTRRWGMLAIQFLCLGVIAWAYTTLAVRNIKSQPTVLSDPVEARHLALAEETFGDLKLDFSRSVSGPLKQWLPHRTDGVVQPLWPWLSAWVNGRPDWEAARVLAGARWLQVGLALGFLLTLGLTCLRSFSLPAALLVVLLTGFYGLLPEVGEFTGAALFQLLFLLTWITCIYGMQRNSLWVYGLAGAFGALAYLTDERMLPLLLTFVLVSTLRALWQWLAEHWPRQFGESVTLWVPRNHALGLMLMVALFGFIAGPRLAESHERFGRAFFHYQNQVRWLDDAAAARAWIEEHPDARRLAAVSPPDWPGKESYFRQHPDGAGWQRLRQGVAGVLAQFGHEGGLKVGLLLVILIGMAAAMPWATGKAVHAGQRLHPETVPAVFFMVLTAAVHVVIAGWDAPVTGAEGRLRLLLPPLVLGLLWGCESLKRRAQRRQVRGCLLMSYQGLLWLMVVLEAWQVIQQLQAAPTAP